jgi:hypothetical protein
MALFLTRMNTFQQLYESEINFSVSCFWDGGFDVKLGDQLNGFAAEAHLDSWDEVEPWLQSKAQLYYPESGFAKSKLGPI